STDPPPPLLADDVGRVVVLPASSAPRRPSVPAPVAPSVAEAPKAGAAAPTASIAATTEARAAPPRPPSFSSVQEAAQLARAADPALKSGDSTRAFRLLDEHAARFPRGVLEPERSAEHILALCAAGRGEEARQEAEPFLKRGTGPLRARVQASCARTP